jgi:hypothetical protein
MSWSKRQLERQMDEGWASVGEKWVCPQCFEDYAIRRFIRENADSAFCTYCGRQFQKPFAAEMDEVLAFIAAGLSREFEDAEHCIPWESAEGGWQLPVDDAFDLFDELALSESQAVCDDLIRAFSDRQFAQKDPFSLRESDALRHTWEYFCEQIKHKTRFVFYRTKSDPVSMEELRHTEPFDILDTLGKLARHFRAFSTLKAGSAIVRARQHESGKAYTTAAELGPPPKENASQSRMSPAGIPMFYGAEHPATALLETFDKGAKKNKSAVTLATFRNTRPLRLLDLTAFPSVPSLFDRRRYADRMALIFLHAFREDAEQPVTRNGSEHDEYVPTQVVAEYFRHVFRIRGAKRLDGIKFRSTKAGVCYSLFLTAEDCCDAPPQSDKPLYLDSFRTIDTKRPKKGTPSKKGATPSQEVPSPANEAVLPLPPPEQAASCLLPA